MLCLLISQISLSRTDRPLSHRSHLAKLIDRQFLQIDQMCHKSLISCLVSKLDYLVNSNEETRLAVVLPSSRDWSFTLIWVSESCSLSSGSRNFGEGRSQETRKATILTIFYWTVQVFYSRSMEGLKKTIALGICTKGTTV